MVRSPFKTCHPERSGSEQSKLPRSQKRAWGLPQGMPFSCPLLPASRGVPTTLSMAGSLFFKQHLRQRRSRRHHRINIRLGMAIEYQQLRLRRAQEALEQIPRLVRHRILPQRVLIEPPGVNLVSLGNLHEIRIITQIRLGIVALVEQLLP